MVKPTRMTTYIPKVYTFANNIKDISDAVADHVIKQQNEIFFDTISTEELSSMSREQKLNYLEENKYTSKRKNSVSSINSLSGASLNSQKRNSITTIPPHNTNTDNSDTNSSPTSTTKQKLTKVKKIFKVGISGGSLLDILKHGLLPRQEDIFWSKWEIFLLDERLVPFQDPESNYGNSKRKIFSQIDTEKYGKPKVYHIDESLIYEGAQTCAENYEMCLINKFASKETVKWPCFDLILLGVAPDGHIGSLFPNRKELREASKWVIPITDSPVGVKERVSLTIPVICNSSHISFVVEGSMKQPIMEKIMEMPELALPSSLVNEGALKKVSWFVDEDAIKGVHVIKRAYEF